MSLDPAELRVKFPNSILFWNTKPAIGVSLFPNSILKKINELFFRKKEISMSKDLEVKLYELFYEDILLLEEMLEIDLSSWKR